MERIKIQTQLMLFQRRTFLFIIDTNKESLQLVGLNGYEFPIISVIIKAIRNFVKEYFKQEYDQLCVIFYNTKATKNKWNIPNINIVYYLGEAHDYLIEKISTIALYDSDSKKVSIEDVFKLAQVLRADEISPTQFLCIFLIQFTKDYKLHEDITSEFWNTVMNVIYISVNNVHCNKFECKEIDYTYKIHEKQLGYKYILCYEKTMRDLVDYDQKKVKKENL